MPSRSRAPTSERSASTAGTCASWRSRCARSSTRSGRQTTRVVVTSDLDEYAIAALAAAPVDAYGVGTPLVTGSGHPTCGFVYKLVARENDEGVLQSVAKKSVDKVSVGGRKYALRRRDADGVAEAEVIGIGTRRATSMPFRTPRPRLRGQLATLLVRWSGTARWSAARPLEVARERHAAVPVRSCRPTPAAVRGEPVIPTVLRGGRCTDGAAHVRATSRRSLMRATTITVILPQATEEQIGLIDQPLEGPPPRALPAARALRRPHRVAAVHQHRAVRRRPRPRRRDAGGRPQLLRQRGPRCTATGTGSPKSCPARGAVLPRLAAREDTFVAGLSMGGYGALKHAFTQPDRYAAVATLSGVARIQGL